MIAHGIQQRCSLRCAKRTATSPATPVQCVTPVDSPSVTVEADNSPDSAGVSAGGLDLLAAAAAPAADPNKRWEVEKVLDSRETDAGVEFRIRWKDCGPEDDSWEHSDDVGADPIAAYHGWAAPEKTYERFTHTFHPKLSAAQPDWRRKKAVVQRIYKRPKYRQRLVSDREEKEENRGWKAKQLKHDNHLKFEEANAGYMAGLKTRPAPGAEDGKWADLWCPREVWALESTQSNLYGTQKIQAKLEDGKDLDAVDLAFLRHNGFSSDSCRFFSQCTDADPWGSSHCLRCEASVG